MVNITALLSDDVILMGAVAKTQFSDSTTLRAKLTISHNGKIELQLTQTLLLRQPTFYFLIKSDLLTPLYAVAMEVHDGRLNMCRCIVPIPHGSHSNAHVLHQRRDDDLEDLGCSADLYIRF